MSWHQKEIVVKAHERGFSLVTKEILKQLPEISNVEIGTLHLFIKHTSASLSINENADPTVRADLESHFNVIVPEKVAFIGPIWFVATALNVVLFSFSKDSHPGIHCFKISGLLSAFQTTSFLTLR